MIFKQLRFHGELARSSMTGASQLSHQSAARWSNRFVNRRYLAESAAFVAFYIPTVSKRDLKHFSKSDILGFASAVFMDSPSPGGRLNHDDYNLEQFTNILISLELPKHNSSFAPGFANKELKD